MNTNELFSIICPELYKNVPLEVERFPNMEDLNGKSPMVFSVLGNEERQLYEGDSNKRNFRGSSETIKIFNMEIDEFYSILIEKDLSGLHDLLMKKLRKYCSKMVPPSYVFTTHMFLHELGHYQQYLDRGKNVYEYTSWCNNEAQNIFIKQNKLAEHIQTRINNRIPPLLTTNKVERSQLKRLSKDYRNLPIEKEADSFAYKHMKEAIEKIVLHNIN